MKVLELAMNLGEKISFFFLDVYDNLTATVNIPLVGEWTIIELLFGAGAMFFIGFAITKFFTSIIT